MKKLFQLSILSVFLLASSIFYVCGVTQKEKDQMLFWSVEEGLEEVKKWLNQGANIDVLYNDWMTPLHEAVDKGKADVVKYLVEQGANLEVEDSIYKRTPLQQAAAQGKLELVKILLGENAKKRKANTNKLVDVAIDSGNYQLVMSLLEQNYLSVADLNKGYPLEPTLLDRLIEKVKNEEDDKKKEELEQLKKNFENKGVKTVWKENQNERAVFIKSALDQLLSASNSVFDDKNKAENFLKKLIEGATKNMSSDFKEAITLDKLVDFLRLSIGGPSFISPRVHKIFQEAKFKKTKEVKEALINVKASLRVIHLYALLRQKQFQKIASPPEKFVVAKKVFDENKIFDFLKQIFNKGLNDMQEADRNKAIQSALEKALGTKLDKSDQEMLFGSPLTSALKQLKKKLVDLSSSLNPA